MYQVFALIMALQVEVVVIVGAGWWLGGKLNESYPATHDWHNVTMAVAAVVVVATCINDVRRIILIDKRRRDNNRQDTDTSHG